LLKENRLIYDELDLELVKNGTDVFSYDYFDKDKEDTNAEMRYGFYFKNRQLDLTNEDEKMPQLAENLTFEKKMEEFHEFSISFKFFLVHNLKSRHIILTTFDRMSIVYDRYMRAGNLAAQLAMFAFFLTIFFITFNTLSVIIKTFYTIFIA